MPKKSLRFTTTLARHGNKPLIVLPESVSAVWGDKPYYFVTGTVGGRSLRGRTERIEGRHALSLGQAWLRDNPLPDDEQIEVELWQEPPQVEDLPDDFADALRAQPEALTFFESLATFYRKGYLRWIEEAKRPETRARRIQEAVQLLREGRAQR